VATLGNLAGNTPGEKPDAKLYATGCPGRAIIHGYSRSSGNPGIYWNLEESNGRDGGQWNHQRAEADDAILNVIANTRARGHRPAITTTNSKPISTSFGKAAGQNRLSTLTSYVPQDLPAHTNNNQH